MAIFDSKVKKKPISLNREPEFWIRWHNLVNELSNPYNCERSEAIQAMLYKQLAFSVYFLDCFAAYAPRNDSNYLLLNNKGNYLSKTQVS